MSACKHFNKHDQNFNNHRKSTVIEQLTNIKTTTTETLKERQKQKKHFSIIELETFIHSNFWIF